MRALVKKALKELEATTPVPMIAVAQWFQLWTLQRDLKSLTGTPHKFVLDHTVDCPEVREALAALRLAVVS